MANHKSAVKAHRQSLLRRNQNRHHRARLRTALKKARLAIAAGDVELAKTLLPSTISLLDRASKVGAIHDNAASRTKARLHMAVHRIAAG